MLTDEPMIEPLVVTPKTTCRLLGIGTTKLYKLLSQGELVSYRDGGARRITYESVKNYVNRRV